MKALEILKYTYNAIDQLGIGHISTEYTEEDFLFLYEAIKELEELENRSCSNCKHSLYLHNTKNIINSELVCKIDSRYNHKDFCCNRWENKQ